MRRLHLFEFNDQAWFPARLRDAGTAYLRFAAERSGHAALLAPKLAEALRMSGARRIVDLCSGGGGPIPTVVAELERGGTPVVAHLTDFFPDAGSFASLAQGSNGRLSYEREPVDATRVPERLTGLRTLFNAFHHFRPCEARHILADAAAARQPIAVFELVGREPLVLLGILFAPLFSAVAMLLLRPLRWDWLLFTFLIPIIPLYVLWDGVVSCLRVYSAPELEELVRGVGAPDYRWETGRIRLGRAPVHATYLIGLPGGAAGHS